jgi:hypothetical protein
MRIRRMMVAAVLATTLGTVAVPTRDCQAQIGYPAASPTETHRRPTRIGWIGLLGLAGLLGLFGNRRSDRRR